MNKLIVSILSVFILAGCSPNYSNPGLTNWNQTAREENAALEHMKRLGIPLIKNEDPVNVRLVNKFRALASQQGEAWNDVPDSILWDVIKQSPLIQLSLHLSK